MLAYLINSKARVPNQPFLQDPEQPHAWQLRITILLLILIFGFKFILLDLLGQLYYLPLHNHNVQRRNKGAIIYLYLYITF